MTWFTPSEKKPPLHQQVLVEMREGVGTVCDVACYLGHVTADGETAEKWLLTDHRLDARQIKRWAAIYPVPPKNEVREMAMAAKAVIDELLDHEGAEGFSVGTHDRVATLYQMMGVS